jgi:hypothetical protein
MEQHGKQLAPPQQSASQGQMEQAEPMPYMIQIKQ